MDPNVTCPFSLRKADETVVRLVALMTFLIAITGIFTYLPLVALLLAIDFGIRALTPWTSGLAFLGKTIAKTLKLPSKPINAGPKIFAARLGFGLALVIATLGFTGWTTAATILAGALAFFAALEAFFAVCVGCHLYTLLLKIKGDG